MRLIIVAVFVAIFSTGCVSQSKIDAAINQKIAENNVAFVQPMMAQQNQQISSVRADVTRNHQLISKSNAQVSTHHTVLVDHYLNQQELATEALSTLSPGTGSHLSKPVSSPATNPTAKTTLSAPVSATEVVPEPVAPATSD